MSVTRSKSSSKTWLIAAGIAALLIAIAIGKRVSGSRETSTAAASEAPGPQPTAAATPQANPTEAQREQLVPLPSYRVGAYASSGIPVWGGFIDYLTYINES